MYIKWHEVVTKCHKVSQNFPEMEYFLNFVRKGREHMFSGEYEHSLDTKGRVIMPSKFRESLGEVFYVTKGLDHNLLVFSQEEWNVFYDKLNTLPMANKSARGFSRLFLSGAIECEANSQGRVLIPANLRSYAEIEKDVTIIGNGNKVEIWSTENWNKYIDALDPEMVAESLCEIGINI